MARDRGTEAEGTATFVARLFGNWFLSPPDKGFAHAVEKTIEDSGGPEAPRRVAPHSPRQSLPGNPPEVIDVEGHALDENERKRK